jgi:hypothetical protein
MQCTWQSQAPFGTGKSGAVCAVEAPDFSLAAKLCVDIASANSDICPMN